MQISAPGPPPETAAGRLPYWAPRAPWRQVRACVLLLTAEKLVPARVDFLSASSFALKENSFVRPENSKVNKEKEHSESDMAKREVNM